MGKQVRYFKQIEAHLEKRYGREKTAVIMNRAFERYEKIVDENRDEPKAYHMHTRQRIYPAIAMFDAMIENGIGREETASFLIGYYKWRSEKLVPFIQRSFKIPGLYRIVPKLFFRLTEMSFGSSAGFSSKDRYVSKTEMRLNMTGCPYNDKCRQYGCPEIVRGFCDADDICYGNMHPKISWDRTKTLGYGADACDFRVHIRE